MWGRRDSTLKDGFGATNAVHGEAIACWGYWRASRLLYDNDFSLEVWRFRWLLDRRKASPGQRFSDSDSDVDTRNSNGKNWGQRCRNRDLMKPLAWVLYLFKVLLKLNQRRHSRSQHKVKRARAGFQRRAICFKS